MINLPNEIILLVFRHLSQRDRKQLRLVSKRYASAGALVLIDTIYISPYKPDIEVFTKVTSHPSLSKGVKHVFYDTARFHFGLHEETYYELLRHDFFLKSSYMTSCNVSNAAYDDFSNLMLAAEAQGDEPGVANTKLGLRLCLSQSAFRDGYEKYCELAQQAHMLPHGNPWREETSWHRHVVDGLTKLGPVRFVTLDNSFAKHHWVGRYALHDVDPYGPAQPRSRFPAFEGEEKRVSAHSTVGLIESGLNFGPLGSTWTYHAIVRSDGTRPVGSPLARSWPPQFLQPLIRGSSRWDQNNDHLLALPTEGQFELGAMIKLIKSAGKLHTVQQVCVPPAVFDTDAVSHLMFQPTDLGCPQFVEASNYLEVLELCILCMPHSEYGFNMGILKSFLGNASSLQEMLLDFQPLLGSNGNLAAGEVLLSNIEVFPPFLNWKVPNLKRLELIGVSFTFRELSGLLFIKLAQLKSLTFRLVGLTDGHWEDVIEGLNRLRRLSYCNIGYGIILEDSGAYAIHEGIWDMYHGDRFGNVAGGIDHYIVHGGRHPLLPENASDTASNQYSNRLDQTLEELSSTHEIAIRKTV